jgi:hypothetical protein
VLLPVLHVELAALRLLQALHAEAIGVLEARLQQAAASNTQQWRRAEQLKGQLQEAQRRSQEEVARLRARLRAALQEGADSRAAYEAWLQGEREGAQLRLRQTEVGMATP